MPLLDPNLFGGMYTPGPDADIPYPDTTFMGLLTGSLSMNDPAGGIVGRRPSGWGKTVSLEGGFGPGRPSPPEDSDGFGDASGGPGRVGDVETTGVPRKKPGFGDILNKIGDMINARSGTLMALGAGMAGAPSLGQGIGRGLQLALPAMQTDIAQQKQNQTVQFLAQRGMPPELAQLAVNNPEVLKSLLPRLFGVGKQYQHVTITDAMGQQHIVTFDPDTGKIMSAGGEAGAGGASMNMDDAVEATKEYMNSGKLPKSSDLADIVSAAHAYMTGGVMPTGNPRQRTIADQAKRVAQRVAAETGRPELADDALYPQRRTMAVDLARSGNSNMGGILTNGSSAFHHLGELSDAFVNQGQYGAESSIPGSAAVAKGINWLTGAPGSPITSSSAAGKFQAVRTTAGHYGQESTKFYSGTGGGEAERTRALNETAAPGTTATEQAAFLEQERNLMLDRLREKIGQAEGVLGPGIIDKKFPKYYTGIQREIDRIDANIKRLREGAPPLPASKPTVTAPSAAPGGPYKPGATIRYDRFGNVLP